MSSLAVKKSGAWKNRRDTNQTSPSDAADYARLPAAISRVHQRRSRLKVGATRGPIVETMVRTRAIPHDATRRDLAAPRDIRTAAWERTRDKVAGMSTRFVYARCTRSFSFIAVVHVLTGKCADNEDCDRHTRSTISVSLFI